MHCNKSTLFPADMTESMSCDFDEGWMCGWKQAAESGVLWMLDTTGEQGEEMVNR